MKIEIEDFFGNTLGIIDLPSFDIADQEKCEEGLIVRVQNSIHIDNSGREKNLRKEIRDLKKIKAKLHKKGCKGKLIL